MDTYLRAERTRRALRPGDLAQAVGVHPMSILRWERRERLPGPQHIHALARALEVEVDRVAGFFDEVRDPTAGVADGVRGHGLRRLRRRVGVSVTTIADQVGVGAPTVYNWESGRARIPEHALGPLAGLLGVTVGSLVDQLRSAPPAPATDARPVGALRRLRLRSRLSQEAAAEAVGVHRHTLGAWERGEGRPSLAAARRLARAFGVPVGDVARAAGLEPPPLLDPRHWRPGDLPGVLSTLRAWSGVSQRRLASLCGCSVATVRAWEAGRTSPRPESRRRLERTYGLPEGALLAAVRPRTPDQQAENLQAIRER